jgi:hypothetical protein
MNFNRGFHLDPDPNGGGGNNSASTPDNTTPAAPDLSNYVPKADFERVFNDYRSFREAAENRFQQFESRLPKPEIRESAEPTDPHDRLHEYDFNNDPNALRRWNADLRRFQRHQEQKELEASQSEAQSQAEYQKFVRAAHRNRVSLEAEYTKAHPEYQQDIAGARILVPDRIGLEINSSKFAPHIIHHLAKNPTVVNQIMDEIEERGMGAALRFVGRLEAKFEHESTTKPAPRAPTRGAFPGGSGGGSNKKTIQELREIYG